MNITASRILKYALFAFAVLAALIVLFINRNLASLADLIYPGSLLWAHGSLLAVEAVAFFWFWRGVFGGREHLLHADDDSPEGRAAFARELVRRVRTNPHVLEADLVPSGPEDKERIDQCLALLNKKADAEIEQNARRVFLATALSQNGKLDALIVFISLCRLVWRISAIYNQRPHPREILSLYWAVVTTTFLALSLEELDITTEIGVGFGQALHAMAPAGLTASIPFAGKALQTVTAAAIDGTANCYLALRAGIITRNAYAYAFAEKRPSRAAVFREAGGILLSMSTSLMDKLGVGVADALTGAVRTAQNKTVRASKGLVKTIGVGLGMKSRETDQG
ncbi:exported hypothetical protein [uncultured delta proteobacterium]|uniref:TIGR01620 family protein n=1 Tax=uncultured delta proteobacterium TaxID=34034 RepID=A0A212JP19_9DELT|nr:exported hypothetical protein [uncultured delta proteobacterium]